MQILKALVFPRELNPLQTFRMTLVNQGIRQIYIPEADNFLIQESLERTRIKY